MTKLESIGKPGLNQYPSMEGLQTDSSANVRVYAIFKQNTTQFTWSSTKPNFFNHFSCYYQLCDTLGVGTGVDSKFHHNIVVHEGKQDPQKIKLRATMMLSYVSEVFSRSNPPYVPK